MTATVINKKTGEGPEELQLYVFTDPMMGLSYEQEPVLEKLKHDYQEKLNIHYIMAGLVRDVCDFMTPAERAFEPAQGIAAYNKRLAQIYLQEEALGGLPMEMSDFHLFDPEHRSSYPLNLAFEAVRLLAPEKAEAFLYAVRRATIQHGIPTTHTEELVKIAVQTGLDKASFLQCLQDGRAEAAFQKDLQLVREYQVHSLPSYLIRCDGKEIIFSGLPSYAEFQQIIRSSFPHCKQKNN